MGWNHTHPWIAAGTHCRPDQTKQNPWSVLGMASGDVGCNTHLG